MKKKINQIFAYIMCIIVVLRLTNLVNNSIFSMLVLIFFFISSIFVIYNARNMDYKKYVKDNYLIFIYISIRILSVVVLPDKVANLKTLFYEVYFLIIVYGLYNKDRKTIYNVSLLLIILNLIINIITIVIIGIFGKEDFITTIYTNTNPIGSLTGICILLFINFFWGKSNKIIAFIYIIFSLVVIFLSESRTPLIVLIFYFLSKLVIKYKIMKPIKLKKYFMNLINIFIVCVIIFSYITKFMDKPSDIEIKINDFTTNRYYLWKYSIISLEDSPVLGVGENNIGEMRYKKVPEKRFKHLWLHRKERLYMNNNHNGYIQLLVANGYLAYIVFMIWMYKNSIKLPMEKFYIISAILVLNMFETQLIMTANIGGFLLIYFLKSEEN